MKESKAYKTFLGYATGAVPPKIARKFKKASPSKKDTSCGNKVKNKEEVDVTRGKGIDLLSEVALTEEAQMKEVRKKSLRNFHKTHPSGSGTVAKKPPRVDKITPIVTSEGTGDKPGVPDVTEDVSTENNEQDTDGSESDSEFNQQEYEEEVKDDDEEEDEIVHTPSSSDDEEDANLESKNDDKSEEITQEQVVEDAHVTILTVAKEAEVLDTSFSRSSDLASKFQIFSDIHPNDAEIVSPLDVHVNLAKVSSQPQSTYEATAILTEFELKKILIDKMNKSKSFLTAPEHQKCYDGLIKSYNLDKDFFSSYDVYSLKRSRKEKDKDEDPFAGSDRGIKKIKTRKDTKPNTEFKVVDTDMPQDERGNLGNDDDEPRKEYGYLREIEVRRADNMLYTFKEGDIPRLCLNDIEDMLVLVAQNWLTNLSGDDVADFAIALKMFTRSLVLQKRVRDLQLGVESYQKKINVTKLDTVRPDL
uniref:Uncharacterized protein n=1 Tax=Tanacetum cinerariifolium TaxID=118510 RepID=A0A6L2LJ42_TANCI|nr:hypothetical protein [Tanacetum cinerariifolium]